jgi:hypothetical protein
MFACTVLAQTIPYPAAIEVTFGPGGPESRGPPSPSAEPSPNRPLASEFVSPEPLEEAPEEPDDEPPPEELDGEPPFPPSMLELELEQATAGSNTASAATFTTVVLIDRILVSFRA